MNETLYFMALVAFLTVMTGMIIIALGWLAFGQRQRLMELRAIRLVHGWTHIPPDGPRNWLGIPVDWLIVIGEVILAFGFVFRYFSIRQGADAYLKWLGPPPERDVPSPPLPFRRQA